MNIKSGLGLQTKIDVLSNKISSLNGKKMQKLCLKCKHWKNAYTPATRIIDLNIIKV